MSDSAKNNAEQDFSISRVFDAPPALVFRAWTEPALIMQWWGPHGFTSPECHIDFRVGGEFRFCMRGPDGKEYWNKGTYQEIVVPEKIVCSMYFADPAGNIVSPEYYGMVGFPPEMIDIVTFAPHGTDQTLLTVRRNHSVAIAVRFMEDIGWGQTLDRFAAVVAALEKQ